ncbi:MAG: glycosyltransferase family 39 protein [Anaerolineaceae bacterium]|nr:glycosyltransferase family 39 protein [Anaerolineaceae bacterium]
MKVERNQKIALWIGLLILAGLSAWYLLTCMAFAPWGFSDSASYFSAARNFAAGIGLGTVNPDGTFARLKFFAPFYPVALSPFVLLKMDLIDAARLLDVLCFTSLLLSGGWLFARITRSTVSGFLFALLLAFTPALGRDFISMMSEPLALALGIPALLLGILAVREISPWRLLLSAVLGGLAFLTRYAFLAVPLTCGLLWLFLARTSAGKRWGYAVLFALLSLLPMLAWLGTEFFASSSVGARLFFIPADLKSRILSMFTKMYEVLKYWLPYRSGMIPGVRAEIFSPILLVGLAALVIFGLVHSFKRWRHNRDTGLSLLLGGIILYVVLYTGVLLFSYSFSATQIDINERMLSPLAPALYALLLGSAGSLDRVISFKWSVPLVGILLSALFVGYNYMPLRTMLINTSAYPDGYASPAWKNNPIFTKIAALPQGVPLLSNAPDVMLFYTNRSSYTLSINTTPSGAPLSEINPASLDEMISTQCGYLVLFPTDLAVRYDPITLPIGEQEITKLSLTYPSIYQAIDGTILTAAQCSQ